MSKLHIVPTEDEFNNCPALKSAWDEYIMIRKLSMGDAGKVSGVSFSGLDIPDLPSIAFSECILDNLDFIEEIHSGNDSVTTT